ncbi:hypothetical protein M436DRAFT_81910 [Aureobasidium namibiae CBS 147.97]|uniref:Mediator of RNA polymerase II transcription subunit 16 n=1 Tax=Aureobasidium namibiae CBS 147.97 TaxID=1043004 RepID=A0A074WPJ7_9PEZI
MENIDVDELFGEESINAAIAATFDTDALFQRIERSHIVGCCQRLAWSRTSCIAQISADSRKVVVRALCRDKNTANWSLSDETEVNASEGAIFTHVEWSSSGFDLVIADQFGRFTLFSLTHALNSLERRPVNLTSSVDDLNQVVGLHWLPTNPAGQTRTALILPAAKEGNRWVNTMKLHEVHGVSNPIDNKAAFLCVTRRGLLKLIYEQPGQPWSQYVFTLDNLADSGDVLTHAAFCQANQHLVMVTYDTSKRLRLYKIMINWNANAGDGTNHKTTLNPQIAVLHVELLDRCVPQSSERAASAQLSSLHVEPISQAIDNSTFTVVAVFTSAAQDHSGKFSIISRWDLQQVDATLHDSFKSLRPTTAQPATNKPVQRLYRTEDIFSQKAILALQSNVYHNMFAFAASDGTVEFRSRETMQIIISDGDTNKATSLPQNGFSFPNEDCIDIFLSPSLAASVITKPDGTLKLHNAEYQHNWKDAKDDNDLAQAAVVSLARELASVTCYQIGFDDLLSVIPTDLDRSLRCKFISEIFRTISRNVDFSLDDPKLQSGKVLKDSLLFRIASAQLLVSYNTNPKRRDIPAKSAWVLLNLRSVCTNIAQTLTMTQQIRGMHNMESSLFVSLKGLVRWSLDLMTLIFDDMIETMRFCKGDFDRGRILAYIHEKNSVSLHILLCSTTRALLGMLGNLIRNFAMRVVKTQEKVRLSSRTNDIRDSVELQQMEAMMGSELPFEIKLFEQLVAEVDGNVRATYQAAQSSPPHRSFYEQSMLVDADIPEALSPVLQRLFGEIVPRLESQIDGVAIYLRDTAWLDLGEDEEAIKRAERQQYDVLRKCAIPPNAKVRQCRRCGSVIENLTDGHMAAWVQNAHKMCICLSHWTVV